MKKKSILYLSDLYYPAKGRNYYEEDLFIVSRLMDDFDVVICNPRNAESFEDYADLIVFRNTGAVLAFKDVYQSFTERVRSKGLNTFNEFVGKGDMSGKQYLLDLTLAGYPVIQTVDSMADFHRLPEAERYVIKPRLGADSIGLEFLSKEELFSRRLKAGETLIEPAIDFVYELSFYFINDIFEYALYAPNTNRRWELCEYKATAEDLAFAKKFIDWNDIRHGIQRVDACRTRDGGLLLVEMEDLNPYLSLLQTEEDTRKKFLSDLKNAFDEMI